ncbi:MAG TPA: methyltransferase domain-containing protein [Fimbriimonas sp.]|nr:methyltransferase domain-containing protein [Fimbriimonas sp.]
MSSESKPREWERFFDVHAERYDENPFTFHTVAEIDFFLSLFALPAGATILDMGCGTGRHAIELARRGFRVTGVDRSIKMLEVARSKPGSEDVEFLLGDATEWVGDRLYDAAICLCEGGFGLIESGENADFHDRAILRNIGASLKPNAPFLLTALNGYSIIRQMSDEKIAEGRFNPANMYANYQDQLDLPEGPTMMTIYERLFIAPEVVRMLQECGFVVDNVFGGTAGHWARRFLSLDEVEAMFVSRKRPA